MAEIRMILRLILWLMSFAGISAFAVRTLHLKPEASPFVALSFISALLTLSGMIGILKAASVAVYASGFAYPVFSILSKRKSFFKNLSPAVTAACAVWIVYLIFRLYNYLPYENDDLSHWALSAREILRSDRLPDASADILGFVSYPLSAAVNIYYFCRFVGDSEWLFAFAQAFYRLIAFLPLLALIRKNRLFGYASFLLAFLFISRSGGYIVSLRVDPLLTAYGIGAFASLLSMEKHGWRTYLALLPVFILLTLTKNSGIFFALATACAFSLLSAKGFRLRPFLFGAGASGLSFAAWLLYVRCTFPQGFQTKHAVNPIAYLSNAADKGVETTLNIARALVKALFSPLPSDLMIYALFALAVLTMAVLIARFKKRSLVKPFRLMLVFLIGVYLSYLVFLFLMYIASMPEKEALAAASFPRYHRTVTLYMGGIALAFVYKTVCHERICMDRARKTAVFSILMCLLALTLVSSFLNSRSGIIFSTVQDRSSRREAVIQTRNFHRIEDGKAYLIFCSPDENTTENNTDSIYYLYKYEFSSVSIGLVYESGEKDGTYIFHTYGNKRAPMPLETILTSVSDDYDYLIFHEDNPAFLQALSSIESTGRMKICAPDEIHTN